MSDTPMTDAAEHRQHDTTPPEPLGLVDADVCRELERELNAANRQIEADRKAFDILIEKARVADGRELLEWVATMTERIENMESDVDELPRWKRYGAQADDRIAKLEAHVARLEEAGDACAEEAHPTIFCNDATVKRKVDAMDSWNKAKEARP